MPQVINAEIILSLRPEWCRKVFSGEKTIEIRKTIPRKGMPFKVFVYETKPGAGKIVGEFVVRRFWCNYRNKDGGKSCLTDTQIIDYGSGKAYGWEISDVSEYVNPVPLGDMGIHKAPQSWMYSMRFDQ